MSLEDNNVSIPVSQNNPTTVMDAVNNTFKSGGENLLDMVKNSLQQANIVTPEQIVQEVETKIAPVPLAPEASTETPKQVEPVVTTENFLSAGEEERSPENSMRNLRKKANELGRTLEEKESALQAAQAEIEKYKTGEIPTEKLATYERRVKDLEKYEKLHALKLSPEFKEQILLPLEQAKQDAVEFVKSYELPAETVDKATSLTGKELNYFLRDRFDEIGVMEFKQKLTVIKDRENARATAEAEPERVLAEILSSTESAREYERQEAVANLSKNSTSGWKNAIQEIQQEGLYPELMVTDDNSEHNNYSAPIIQRAASEYGKFVNLLAQLGAKDLPPEAAKIIAKRFQLSEAAVVMSKSREAHYSTAEDLIRSSQQRAPYARPNIGSGVNGGSAPSSPTSITPEMAAEALVNKFFK